MTLTRRDALHLAASAAAAGTAPFAVLPHRAAALLAHPAGCAPGPGRFRIGEPNHTDVVQFAESIDAADWTASEAIA